MKNSLGIPKLYNILNNPLKRQPPPFFIINLFYLNIKTLNDLTFLFVYIIFFFRYDSPGFYLNPMNRNNKYNIFYISAPPF